GRALEVGSHPSAFALLSVDSQSPSLRSLGSRRRIADGLRRDPEPAALRGEPASALPGGRAGLADGRTAGRERPVARGGRQGARRRWKRPFDFPILRAHERQHPLAELLEAGQVLRENEHDPLRPRYGGDVVESRGALLVRADDRRNTYI